MERILLFIIQCPITLSQHISPKPSPLATHTQEAKDNVILVNEKIKVVESIDEVMQLQMEAIGDSLPEDISHHAHTRLVTLRRIARRMRMKYQPLISILDGLGGEADLAKNSAAKLSKSLLSANMALSCMVTMLRKHNDREEARAVAAGQRLLDFLPDLNVAPAALAAMDAPEFASLLPSSASANTSLQAFRVFQAAFLSCRRAVDVLDALDVLVIELKAQDSLMQAELEGVSSENEANEHSSGYSLMMFSRKKRTAIAPSALDAATRERYRQAGADLLLAQLCPATFDCGQTVDVEECLPKAMGRGYSADRVRFLVRQLGEMHPGASKRAISRERMRSFILNDGAENAGFNVALIASAAMASLDFSDTHALLQQAHKIADTIMPPLVASALTFAFLYSVEEMRLDPAVADDPEEIAAMEAQADEAR